MRRQLATVSIGDTTIPLEEPHRLAAVRPPLINKLLEVTRNCTTLKSNKI